jgi:drug/metabolite transporter (DMT)-like permease
MTVQQHSDGNVASASADVQARLMLVILTIIWGLTWPLMKISLNEMPPFTMRVTTAGIGAATLVIICFVMRRSFRVLRPRDWAHIVMASLLNIVGFSLFSAFAQLAAATSRVAILTYTMPIWAVLLAWVVLRERPSRLQGVAMLLCVVGLAVLVRPLAVDHVPIGLALAVASGFSWAAGTVYLKWARIAGDPMGMAVWQLVIGLAVVIACLFVFEGRLHLENAHPDALLSLAFVGIVGNGVAYALWFAVVPRLPAVTSSLGILGAPVIGVISAVLMLGDRPTVNDIVGFALIFAATTCVLLFPPRTLGVPAPMPD